jgi:tetratricopeptide (TPR) repeat protein
VAPPTPAAPAAHPAAAPPDEPAAPAPGEPRGGTASAAESARPRSYEHLVADADRALENGQTGKAQKLYDDALRLQPSGVAAITGAAFLLLDRQKPLAAIDMFQRALSNAPSFPQALFGLGEAHRLAGQPAKAVEAYRRYLERAPTGSDAPAARRQMRELESQVAAAPSRPESEPSAAPPSPAPPSPSPTSPPPQM